MIITIYRETINKDKKIFKYTDKDGKVVKDKKILEYIQNLSIPPAYKDVEIFYDTKGKVPDMLYFGFDDLGRKQQIYSPKWREKADKEKFKSLIEFGRKLPMITLDIQKHIKSPLNTKDKMVSLILRIIMLCGFRIGQLKYQKLYNSTGLSTLLKKHLKFKKNALEIEFIGKKNIVNSCVVTEDVVIKEMEKITKNKSANDHVFTYYDPETKQQKITNAIEVNNWLKKYNPEFTTKYIRTYNANISFIDMVKNIDNTGLTERQRKKIVTNIIKEISCVINNTPAICKKSYLDPDLIKLYIEHPKKFEKEFKNDLPDTLNYITFLEKVHKV